MEWEIKFIWFYICKYPQEEREKMYKDGNFTGFFKMLDIILD